MAPAKPRTAQGTANKSTLERGHVSTLPHHASIGDTLPNDDIEIAGAKKPRQVNPNAQHVDYPTPTSVEDVQLHRQQAFKISQSSSTAIGNISTEPRMLLNAIDKISGLGIQSKSLDLPKIVAIGDQSAGKSSVIAAISGITVPRNAGLCTRCPSHISLHSSSGPWKCVVSLERHFENHEGKWLHLSEPSRLVFSEVEEPEDLQHILLRAQAAILNPGHDPLTFVNCPDSILRKDTQMKFSPNLVGLEISGPDCPDLTFYDLPGIFNQASQKEQQHLPKMVKELVMSYIAPESHVLLVACSMEGDIENSSASSLVPEAAKHRCIGILTKPDRIPEDTPKQVWRSILQGNTFQLGHGYFVTKQPSQRDLNRGIDHAQAREDEVQFFKSDPLWAKDFAAFEDRFGTVRLQAKLSSLLVARIRESIPLLLDQVNDRLREVKEKLASLPDPPGNKSLSIVLKIVSGIHNQLGQHLQGELPHNAFIRRWMDLCNKFNGALFDSRPVLFVITQADREAKAKFRASASFSSSSPSRPDAISIQDSDEDEKHPSPGQKRRAATTATPSPQKKQRLQSRGHLQPISTGTSQSTSGSNDMGNKFSLEVVREIRLDKNTSAIGTHDHRADEYLILRSIKHWDMPLNVFINATEDEVENLTKSLLDQELRDWENTPLSTELRDHVNEYVANAVKRHQEFAYRLLESENIKPMTLNQKSIKPNVEEETTLFQKARRTARANMHIDAEELKTGKFTTGNDRDKLVQKLNDDVLGPDEYSEEIATMGWVRGYYNVASASFVDTICKTMRLDIFERMRLGLKDSIEAKFKLNGNEGFEECKRLLAEDASRAERREYYVSEKEKFEKAKQSLDELVGPVRH